MQDAIRNFLVLGLIMASIPAGASATNPAPQGPIAKEQHKLNNQLLEAIEKGNAKKVKQLLAKGADANTRDQRGIPALIIATCYFYEQSKRVAHQYKIVRYAEEIASLIIRGNIDTAKEGMAYGFGHGNEGSLPRKIMNGLVYICYTENKVISLIKKAHDTGIQMCKLLIDAGADLNAKSHTYAGETALLIASRCGIEPICELLINAGADLNAHDEYGKTALWNAVIDGNLKTCTALLNAGANVDAKALAEAKSSLEGAIQVFHQFYDDKRLKKHPVYIAQKNLIDRCEKIYKLLCSKNKSS